MAEYLQVKKRLVSMGKGGREVGILHALSQTLKVFSLKNDFSLVKFSPVNTN